MAEELLCLRAPSGIAGDMLLTGLARLAGLDHPGLEALVSCLGLPQYNGAVRIEPRQVQGISGWGLRLDLPHAHEHRHLADIEAIIEASAFTPRAKQLCARAFSILAEAEAFVHGISPQQIHFHEVGALDSILDVCLSCALYDMLSPARFVCSPLPVCDGTVRCAHGLLSTPAPAVLKLLEGMPVYGIASNGETLTPTALALLKALDAEFGLWPAMTLKRQERVYGSRILPDVPNGTVFAWGLPHTLL